MAYQHGKHLALHYGKYDLSVYLNDASDADTIDADEVSTFKRGAKAYIVGLSDGTLSAGGFFDGDEGAVHEALRTVFDEIAPVSKCIQGDQVVGNLVDMADTVKTSYEIAGGVDGPVAISAEFQVTGGIELGRLLATLVQRNATGNTTGVDNAVLSSDGGVAHLHVTEFTGATNVVAKVQHSVDNSVWVDLLTMATVTAAGSERKTVAAGTTVNRYLRVLFTLTGTGTFTASLAFARR